jgi:hypothetical protein
MSSHLKETVLAKNIQSGTGAAGAAAEKLDGVVDNRKAAKGVTISNLDGAISIYVGNANSVSATNGYELVAGASIKLEIEDPWSIYVLAASGTPAYSWIAV